MVRILVSSRRPCDSEALATSSYGTYFAQPLSAATFVSAAVNVVLPWSICPIVPTFTCGFDRSNFSFAMCVCARYEVNDCLYAAFPYPPLIRSRGYSGPSTRSARSGHSPCLAWLAMFASGETQGESNGADDQN